MSTTTTRRIQGQGNSIARTRTITRTLARQDKTRQNQNNP